MQVEPFLLRIPQLMTFAVALQVSMVAVGVYGAESLQSIRFATARLLVAVSLGVIALSVIFFIMPRTDVLALQSALRDGGCCGVAGRGCASLLGKMFGGQSSSAASSCSAPARARNG